MPDNDALRERARLLRETNKGDVTTNSSRNSKNSSDMGNGTFPNVLAEKSVSNPTSGSVGVPAPTLSSLPKELLQVKCEQCLQERKIPAGTKAFTCDVCGRENDLSS